MTTVFFRPNRKLIKNEGIIQLNQGFSTQFDQKVTYSKYCTEQKSSTTQYSIFSIATEKSRHEIQFTAKRRKHNHNNT